MLQDVFDDNGQPVYTFATAVSLMLFYVFAMQCMSTMAIVRRETRSWKWPVIQFIIFLINKLSRHRVRDLPALLVLAETHQADIDAVGAVDHIGNDLLDDLQAGLHRRGVAAQVVHETAWGRNEVRKA